MHSKLREILLSFDFCIITFRFELILGGGANGISSI